MADDSTAGSTAANNVQLTYDQTTGASTPPLVTFDPYTPWGDSYIQITIRAGF